MARPDPEAKGDAARRPRDDEVDVFGLTHVGRVRQENQDHFLICQLRKQMDVLLTSLPSTGIASGGTERIAFLAMVADGVGGGTRGGDASRLAVETAARYLAHSTQAYYTADSSDEEAFTRALEAAAMQSHRELVDRRSQLPPGERMATTLTLWMGVWPRAYLLQVGDSRYYMLRNGELTQVSRDQTLAQDLVDQGVLSRSEAARSRFSNVLSSALGGPESTPVVTRIDNGWDMVHLICSDGLNKHVSDERIRERLLTMTSARQVCQDLLQEALEGGGSDNITIIVGRALRSPEPEAGA